MELELPDLGLIPIRDAETGEQMLVDTHDAGFRKRFARIAAQREADLRQAFVRAGVDTLELSTDDDLVHAVMRFADLRKRRSRLSGRGHLPAHMRSGMSPPHPTRPWRNPRDTARHLPVAPVPVAAAGAAAAGAAVPVAAAAQEEAGAALCQPVHRQGRPWAPARACAATSRRCCSCWPSRPCCLPRRARSPWSACR
jgi:hypothetical protein